MECQNCGTHFEGNYCSNCGKPAHFEKGTTAEALQDAVFSLSDLDQNLFNTIRQLAIRPHVVINNYLRGNREGLMKPFVFLTLWAGLIIFLEKYFILTGVSSSSGIDKETNFAYNLGYFAGYYTYYLWIFYAFFLAVTAHLLLGKYSLAGHLVIAAYLLGISTLTTIVLLPLMGDAAFVIHPIPYLAILIFYFRSFKGLMAPWERISLSLATTLLSMVFFWVGLTAIFAIAWYLGFRPTS